MAIRGVHHFSFSVTDIERTIGFYSKMLGLELVAKRVNESDTLGISLGTRQPHAKIKVAIMQAGDTQIEFIEYVDPKAEPCQKNPSIAGSGHIALWTDRLPPG